MDWVRENILAIIVILGTGVSAYSVVLVKQATVEQTVATHGKNLIAIGTAVQALAKRTSALEAESRTSGEVNLRLIGTLDKLDATMDKILVKDAVQDEQIKSLINAVQKKG